MSVTARILCVTLLLTVPAFGQNWVGILDPTRAIDWSGVGIPGGVPTRNTVCTTLTSSASAATINAAFTACLNGQVVLLQAGTYNLTSGLRLQPNADGLHGTNVTLRGAGPLLTIINFTGSDGCMGTAGDVCFINNFAIGGDNNFALPPCGGVNSNNCADWTAGYAKGATQITLLNVGANTPQIGQLLVLDQANDITNAAGLQQCDTVGPCSYSGGAFGRVLAGSKARSGGTYVNGDYSQLQVVRITNIAGSTYTITPGLYANNWRSGQTPGAYWSSTPSAGPLVGAGLENLTVDHTNSASQVSGIEFVNCDGCYMKNVRSIDSQRNHVQLIQSKGTVIRDSYFYLVKNPGNKSYGIEPQGASDALVENNIFEKLASPILLSEGSGLVMGYNFSWNNLYSNPNFMQTSTVHDAGNMMNLFEGNYFNGVSNDVAHGASPLTTLFRNWIPGQEPSFPRTAGTISVEVEPNGRAQNVIANVLGTVGYHTTYESSPIAGAGGCQTSIYLLGWANPNNCTGTSGNAYTGGNDNSVITSMMRWGNYDTVHAAVQWNAAEVPTTGITFVNGNPVPATHALPNSFYLSAEPSFLGALPWPLIGPDVTGGQGPGGFAYQNAAFNCYFATTSTGGVLNFDASNCYSFVGAPGIGFSPPSLLFALQTIGTSSPVQSFTLTNTGTVSLSITSITANGDFSQTNTCPSSLGAGAVCAVSVTFTPSAVANRTGTISVVDNAAGSPHTVALTGTGKAVPNNGIQISNGILISGGIQFLSPNTDITVYVDPNGSDLNPGTLLLPFQTIAKAQNAVAGRPDSHIEIQPGTYPAPLNYTISDSGTSGHPIHYEAVSNGTVIISGGSIVVIPSQSPVADCGTSCMDYSLLMPVGTKNTISLYYNGKRRPRPHATGDVHGWYANACPGTNTAPVCVAGASQSAADTACGCPAAFLGAGGHCAKAATSLCTGATPNQCYNVFIKSASDSSTGSLHAIGLSKGAPELVWGRSWQVSRLPIANIVSTTITTQGADQLTDGDSGCQPGWFYYEDNVRGQASKGQWYLDWDANNDGIVDTQPTLHIYADTSLGENPLTATIVMPSLDPTTPSLVVANNLQYVTFTGLTFSYDNWNPGQFGIGDSQSQPLVSCAISTTGAVGLVFDTVTVSYTQGCGIDFQGAAISNQVINSALYDLGAGGVRFGARAQATDTDANVPNNNLVQNTIFASTGRIQPTGTANALFLGDGHDNIFTHNTFQDFPCGAIELGYGLGLGQNDGSTTTQFFIYNNTVSYNLINGLNSSGLLSNGLISDCGGIYLATSRSSKCTPVPTLSPNTYCNHIVNNVIHDIASNYDNVTNEGGIGIYCDQGCSNNDIRNNLIYRVAQTGIKVSVAQHQGPNHFLPQYILLDNNIIARCGAVQSNRQRCISHSVDANTASNPNAFTATHNVIYFNSALGSFSKALAVPGGWPCFLANGTTADPCVNYFNFHNNDYFNVATSNPLEFSTCKNTVQGATSLCGSPYNSTNYNIYGPTNGAIPTAWTAAFASDGSAAGEDAASVTTDPAFTAPTFAGGDNWTVTANLTGIGFVVPDFSTVGRTSTPITVPSAIADLFPQRPVNPATDY